MVKPILQTYPVIYAENEEERARLRPIGRNKQRYQETVQGWHEVIKAADNLDFWGVATIEHHFWSEGYEVGPAPAIMDAYWAAITRNVRVGQLGYVMSIQNPLRVAEETAIIDHLTQGRSFVGFARGYQSRWTNVFGQHYGTTSTKSPTAALNNKTAVGAGFAQSKFSISEKDVANDHHNRDVFEDNIEIVLKAWTQDSMHHVSENWQIPYPAGTGVDDWQLAHTGVTQRLGALDEVDENNNVVNVSVCPAPYQDPHPPVFVSGSGSPETIDYCARMGFIPTYFTNIDTAAPLGQQYAAAAAKAGFNWKPGQNQNIVRWLQIAESHDAAIDAVIAHDYDIWKNFYAAMGRRKLDQSDVVGSMLSSGLYCIGTAESVRDQLVEQWKQMPAEYITLIYHYAQMPKDKVIRNMREFNEVVKPALDEITAQAGHDLAEAAE
jgi:alkanesulfonate monooxygenase SsuD/methylene tetrahydromethanopterin reductase-like flavin-dependent oxidoreductase (luciferase family)